ncbi:hypothetical protein ABPG74_020251 [Tetrahymena malaccensis]
MNLLKKIPTFVGLGTIGFYSYEWGSRYFYHSINENEIDFIKRYGNCYGLVSGGSQGLGKEYANELAKRGINLVLVARGQESLEKAKQEIKEKHPQIDVKTISFDFSTSKPEDYQKLVSQLKDLDIGILVNNVGVFQHGPLHEANSKDLKNLLVVNTYPVTYLTQNLLPYLSKRNKKSLVINVASEAGEFVHKEFPVYSASKSYDIQLSKCLQQFYKGSNIDVSLFLPGPTYTPLVQKIDADFNKTPYGKAYCADPSQAAKDSFRKIGYQSSIFGDKKHEYFHFMHRYFRSLSEYIYPQTK